MRLVRLCDSGKKYKKCHGKFKIDKLFWTEEEIKDKGIQIISLD